MAEASDLRRALLSEQQHRAAAASLAQTAPELGGGADRTASAAALKAPGGFRRGFLHQQASAAGIPLEQRPAAWRKSLLTSLRPLLSVGYFDRVLGVAIIDGVLEMNMEQRGEAGDVPTVLAICKAFVGSGILFMPGAFARAGWAFSSVTLVGIAALNGCCIGLLLESVDVTGLSSYGDIAERASGPFGRQLVHASLAISQFSIVTCYMLFIAEVAASAGAATYLSAPSLVLCQLTVMVPLGLVRSVERLELAIFVANLGLLFGITTVVGLLVAGPLLSAVREDAAEAAASGGGHAFEERGVVSTDWAGAAVFLGTALYTFEGVGLVLPIRNAMAQPERFGRCFRPTFCGVVTIFVFFGLLGYLAYGNATAAVVLSNLADPTNHVPSTGDERQPPIVLAVRVVYCAVLLLSSPLIFLPGARITELWAFGMGEADRRRRSPWPTNLLRIAEFGAMACVAIFFRDVFQSFVGIVGVVTGAPTAFIYPAFFHLRTVRPTGLARLVDYGCIAFGVAAMLFVGWQTLAPVAQRG